VNVGDIVRQGDRVIKFKGKGKPKRSSGLGIVIAIHAQLPPRNEETQNLRAMMSMLGRRVDVLWESGKLSENFAENSLEVVHESG
jgi:hypothetical protein